MGKTIIVFEDGRVVDTIEEDQLVGVSLENGRLVAKPEDAADARPDGGYGAEDAEGGSADAETDASPGGGYGAAFDGAAVGSGPAEAGEPSHGACQPFADANGVRCADAADAGARPGDGYGAAGAYDGAYQTAQAMKQPYPWRSPAYEDVPSAKQNGLDPKKLIAVLLGLVLAATAGFGGGIAAMKTTVSFPAPAQQITINPTDQVSTTEAVAAKVIPSVVGITSVSQRDSGFFPFSLGPSSGVGTGIIVDESGFILTNSHVVMDGDVQSITVLLSDGREVDGTVLWSDPSLDLAIVKVTADNLVAAELGDSELMKIGSYVAAIGNPLGLNFQSSVSVGVVSGLDRTIVTSDGTGSRTVKMEGLLQVDAAINSGNSGGPLVNSKGEVIGINTAKAQSVEGMGFAIPVNTAKPIVESVKETGAFQRVYIGISPVDVSVLLSEYPHLDLGATSGAYVNNVTQGSPAEAAGILEKDIITEIDGTKIGTSTELVKKLLGYHAGDRVSVTIVRDKIPMKVNVVLTDSLE
ncbi:MAG: trypsin-like peptidase domain-containing protein [Clostridiales Family XIII bacterium]|jgi:S1-C subfamily serine protease|nr:trypsin-like peptidase domain-containing protein [Clostridiales Family XIII bacterium]